MDSTCSLQHILSAISLLVISNLLACCTLLILAIYLPATLQSTCFLHIYNYLLLSRICFSGAFSCSIHTINCNLSHTDTRLYSVTKLASTSTAKTSILSHSQSILSPGRGYWTYCHPLQKQKTIVDYPKISKLHPVNKAHRSRFWICAGFDFTKVSWLLMKNG